MSLTIFEGMVIEGAGGAIAGFMIRFVQLVAEFVDVCRHKRRIYKWLSENANKINSNAYVPTIEISSYTNLTPDRVRYICSIHKKINPFIGYKVIKVKMKISGLYESGVLEV